MRSKSFSSLDWDVFVTRRVGPRHPSRISLCQQSMWLLRGIGRKAVFTHIVCHASWALAYPIISDRQSYFRFCLGDYCGKSKPSK